MSSSVVLIAVIGPTWATESADGKRRLDDADDFVRLEVSGALKRNIRIIPSSSRAHRCRRRSSCRRNCTPFGSGTPFNWSEEYYEEGLERLVDALSAQLGKPRTREGAGQDRAEAERRLKDLRGQAESALAVEDWFAGIQALQAAVSLDPNNADLAARLRWAHDQQRALARRATVRRWTAGTVAAAVVAIVGAGALIVLLIRSEFQVDTGGRQKAKRISSMR